MRSSDFRFYFSIFLRRLPYFLVVSTVIGAASVIVAMTLPPAYVSQMTLIVESPQIPDELAASTASTPAQEQLQIVEQRLLTRANLLDIANRLDVFEAQDEMLPDRVLEAMRSRTTVRSSGRRDAAALIILQMDKSTGISKLRDTSARSNSVPPTVIPTEENIQTSAAEEIPDDTG